MVRPVQDWGHCWAGSVYTDNYLPEHFAEKFVICCETFQYFPIR